MDGKWAFRIFMYCRKISAYKFRTRLGFQQYDTILIKGQC